MVLLWVGKAIHSGPQSKEFSWAIWCSFFCNQTVTHATSALGGGSSETISSHSFQVLVRKVELRERRYSYSCPCSDWMRLVTSCLSVGLAKTVQPWLCQHPEPVTQSLFSITQLQDSSSCWKFLVLELAYPYKQLIPYMKWFPFEISGDCFSYWVLINKYTRYISFCIPVALSMKCC